MVQVTARRFELFPHDSRKSFYGKAKAIITNTNCAFLKSYDTIVCGIDKKGIFHRYWNGYSATTQRHINGFLAQFNKNGIGKKEWLNAKVEDAPLIL